MSARNALFIPGPSNMPDAIARRLIFRWRISEPRISPNSPSASSAI